MPTPLEKEIEKILEEYTSWLCKRGYTDADVYAEEPTAVDRFLKEKTAKALADSFLTMLPLAKEMKGYTDTLNAGAISGWNDYRRELLAKINK